MSFLELKKVTKVYPNGTKAVQPTSLKIDKGEFMVFVGPSGCGKSTLLRMVAGLEDITTGDIKLDKKIINKIDPSERDVAMVFQNYALYPHMNVYNNLAYGLKNRGLAKDLIEKLTISASDYIERYQINADSLQVADPEMILLHPGPVNFGIELSKEASELENCKIKNQIFNGVGMRMAVLTKLFSQA